MRAVAEKFSSSITEMGAKIGADETTLSGRDNAWVARV